MTTLEPPQSKVTDKTSQVEVISDYEAAKHDDHWSNATTTLIMLDVAKEQYNFHCFMNIHSEEFNYSEKLKSTSTGSSMFTRLCLVNEQCLVLLCAAS